MNAKSDLDSQILFILDKLQEEHEVAKRQGFPSRTQYRGSQYSRLRDSVISEKRWRLWANELDIDYMQFGSILNILKNEGLLSKFEFISEYK